MRCRFDQLSCSLCFCLLVHLLLLDPLTAFSCLMGFNLLSIVQKYGDCLGLVCYPARLNCCLPSCILLRLLGFALRLGSLSRCADCRGLLRFSSCFGCCPRVRFLSCLGCYLLSSLLVHLGCCLLSSLLLRQGEFC